MLWTFFKLRTYKNSKNSGKKKPKSPVQSTGDFFRGFPEVFFIILTSFRHLFCVYRRHIYYSHLIFRSFKKENIRSCTIEHVQISQIFLFYIGTLDTNLVTPVYVCFHSIWCRVSPTPSSYCMLYGTVLDPSLDLLWVRCKKFVACCEYDLTLTWTEIKYTSVYSLAARKSELTEFQLEGSPSSSAVIDVIPLFHNHPLLPLTEIALEQVDR